MTDLFAEMKAPKSFGQMKNDLNETVKMTKKHRNSYRSEPIISLIDLKGLYKCSIKIDKATFVSGRETKIIESRMTHILIEPSKEIRYFIEEDEEDYCQSPNWTNVWNSTWKYNITCSNPELEIELSFCDTWGWSGGLIPFPCIGFNSENGMRVICTH